MMEKRDFSEMVRHFCQKVSEMDIARKYKMELLGMVTAIEIGHDQLMPRWIPCSERMPEDEEIYLVRVILKNGKVNWNRAWYDGMTWHGSGMVPEVTHWMKIDLEVGE